MRRDTPVVALRKAAAEWAAALYSPVSRDDREFRRLDARLRRAALQYANEELAEGRAKYKCPGFHACQSRDCANCRQAAATMP